MRCVLATRSVGKLRELVPMLAQHGITGIGLTEAGVALLEAEAEIEAFDTFEANALAKARHFARVIGAACIADDSGLAIDALDGAPGVRSRRFASDHGRREHGAATEDVANAEAVIDACWDSGWAPPWAARFICVVAYADATREVVAHGSVEGHLVPERAGDGGFGYDPWFRSVDLGVTFAEASLQAKALVSHRARAMVSLLAQLRSDVAHGGTG